MDKYVNTFYKKGSILYTLFFSYLATYPGGHFVSVRVELPHSFWTPWWWLSTKDRTTQYGVGARVWKQTEKDYSFFHFLAAGALN